MTDQEYLEIAIKLAEENVRTGHGGPFGAVIVKDDKIIAKGTNSVTTNNDPTAHAEVTAIRNACKNLNAFQLDDCTIYSSCEPCPMCLGAIYWARPKKLVFAASKNDAKDANFDDEFIYHEISKPLPERHLRSIHIPLPNKLEPFELWKKNNNNIKY